MGKWVERTHHKEKCGEAEKNYEWSCEVCVIHNVLVNSAEGIEDCKGFGTNMREVYAQLCVVGQHYIDIYR